VTAVGGVPDVVRDGETALLVPPSAPDALADALVRALADDGLARRLGEAARRRQADAYSLASVTRRYAELYRAVARSRTAVTSR
jgi:glycosyltransferase involved in cell wall biosynthesis